jgi:FKBP-type peptidyl-prolyl cis-trans isomerase FkpA
MCKIFYKSILFVILTITIISCNKNDDNNTVPLKDFNEQYLVDLESIDKFIDTHYMIVDPITFDVTYNLLTSDPNKQSIRAQTLHPLEFRMYENTTQNVNYKLYYINLQEGTNERPCAVDSIHVAFRGVLANDAATQFDVAQNPVWIKLDEVISGWPQIFPLFKTGIYDTTSGPNPVNFQNFGAGIMFIPSGMAYYNNPQAASIPVYTSLVFNFKLYELQFRDHDLDGVLSKNEVPVGSDIFYDPRTFDTDNDGVFNMYDIDDDGDRVLTKTEIKNPVTQLPYPFADIPLCSDGKKKHVSSVCQ